MQAQTLFKRVLKTKYLFKKNDSNAKGRIKNMPLKYAVKPIPTPIHRPVILKLYTSAYTPIKRKIKLFSLFSKTNRPIVKKLNKRPNMVAKKAAKV